VDSTRPLHPNPSLDRLARYALLLLAYLEQVEIVPSRFGPEQSAAWGAIMVGLRAVDRFELAVRDTCRANKHVLAALLDSNARSELRTLDEQAWQDELERLGGLRLAERAPVEFHRLAASSLGISLGHIDPSKLPMLTLDRSALIGELPEGYGHPTLVLFEAHRLLDASHNARIYVNSLEAEMLAGLALVLLGKRLEVPEERIIRIGADDHQALLDSSLTAVLAFCPLPWVEQIMDQVSTEEVIRL